MLRIKNALKLAVLGLSITLLILLFFNSSKTIAESKFQRIITDADGIVNFLDVKSIKNRGQERFYTTVRASAKPATDDYSMPLRRPYSAQRCACPYDYAINGSICGGRSSGKTICFAPVKTLSLLISNSVNCQSKVRSIHKIEAFDAKDKPITSYKADDITGGAYPVAVEVSDRAELNVINAVCKGK